MTALRLRPANLARTDAEPVLLLTQPGGEHAATVYGPASERERLADVLARAPAMDAALRLALSHPLPAEVERVIRAALEGA